MDTPSVIVISNQIFKMRVLVYLFWKDFGYIRQSQQNIIKWYQLIIISRTTMQLQCEQLEKNAIQSYQHNEIIIHKQSYTKSLLVSKTELYTFPALHTLTEIDPNTCLAQLSTKPEILLIGHTDPTGFLSNEQYVKFTQNAIGVECMQLDAACRTFNVLLGELRNVCLLLILPP